MQPGHDARTAYAPRPAWSVGTVAAAGLLVSAGPALDAPGRALAGVACALLLAVAVRDTVQRPVLEAVPPGLLLWSGLRRRLVPWSDVVAVRLGHERHWATRGPLLELDLRDAGGDVHLVVLPPRRLGADPAVVAALLGDLRTT